MDLGLVVIAIAPIVFFAWYMYTRDRYEREPRRLIVKTFLLGAVLVIPVVFAEAVGSLVLPASNDPLALFLHFLVVVAFVEESSKYLAVRLSVYNSREFNELMDGLVYGAIAGLGFAAPENLLYVLSRGAVLGIVRAVLSVPGHALWGSIIGYYLARQKLKTGRNSGLVGLCLATMLHAAFDYALIATEALIAIVIASVIIVAGWIAFFRFRRTALAVSPFRLETGPLSLSLGTKYCMWCGTMMLADDRFCRLCGADQL